MRLLSLKRYKKKPKSIDADLVVSVINGRKFTGTEGRRVESPYVVVRSNHYRFSSPRIAVQDGVVEWDTEFMIPLQEWHGPAKLLFTVWDKSDDNYKTYLGEVSVSFAALVMNENQWLPLRASDDRKGPITGEIQIRVALVSSSIDGALIPGEWRNFCTSFEGENGGPAKSPKKLGPETEGMGDLLGVSPRNRWITNDDIGLSDIDADLNDLCLTDTESTADLSDVHQDESGEKPPCEHPLGVATPTEHGSPTPKDAVAVARKPDTVPSVVPNHLSVSPAKSPLFKRHLSFRRKKIPQLFELNIYNSTLGIIFMEVERIVNLPRDQKNMTRTSFDMDPFVIISFGKKTFRTPHKRHTLNPVYNEKLMFPVQTHEQGFSVKFTVMDKDRLSLNDHIASGVLELTKLMAQVPDPDDVGLYRSEELTSTSLIKHELELKRKSDKPWKSGTAPSMTVSAQFMPYAALRQKLWRNLAAMYDTDETNTINAVELDTLLDSIGSTLTRRTREGFFRRFNKDPQLSELTIDELVLCLESQVAKDSDAYKRLVAEKLRAEGRRAGIPRDQATPGSTTPQNGSNLSLPLDNSKEPHDLLEDDFEPYDLMGYFDESDPFVDSEQGNSSPGGRSTPSLSYAKANSVDGKSMTGSDSDFLGSSGDHEKEQTAERVIQLESCPFCNQPRLGKRSEDDLVTHMAVCANQNWSKVDALVLDRYVTSSQAGKRWYTKAIKKVWYGNYKLGANSANILVQNRITGEVLEEKMSVYVRIGIRLLYKGLKSSRMENKRIKSLLRSLSVKQGRKYDDPSSVQSIEPFIRFHRLGMNEVQGTADSFKNFNEFFYRKLKPGARPCDSPDESRVLVSPADSRATFFPSVTEAQRLWIKGRAFTIARLLGDAYPDMVSRFVDGPLAIFRLAPQDYHRFHSPVDGIVKEPKLIEGEYYTVNPMAIRSALDVYGENVRVLVPIETEDFGTVMVVCVGAMMVGSTVITAQPGPIKRTDELGYFKFGGSTLVVLFEKGSVEFDDDLERNSEQTVETLVRVGMAVGRTPDLVESSDDS